jgi:hypothetical protein
MIVCTLYFNMLDIARDKFQMHIVDRFNVELIQGLAHWYLSS